MARQVTVVLCLNKKRGTYKNVRNKGESTFLVKTEIRMISIRCWATATAAIRQGGPWEPESDVTLAPASLSLSEAIAKGSASKFALISSARSTHKSAAFLCAWPSAYAKGRLPKLARIFEFYKSKKYIYYTQVTNQILLELNNKVLTVILAYRNPPSFECAPGATFHQLHHQEWGSAAGHSR